MPVIGVLNQIDRVGSDCAENIRSGLEEDMGIPFTAVSANGRNTGPNFSAIVSMLH